MADALTPLLDPMDLEHVTLVRRTKTDADGTTSRQLRADGGDIKRTIAKLDVAALGAIDESKIDPTSNGLIECWVPERMRSRANGSELAREQATMDHVLAELGAKTPSGRPVRVAFEFGDQLD
ncbi:MAG TPA: hypothetical protein VGH28_00340 [Polyangiaceae bacterium]